MSHEPLTKQRLRITFGKFGALKYTSNLDVAKLWERVLRRADLPLLYTQGFNTRPRLQLATALPLGITSECELIDVFLREIIEINGLIERLHEVSPAGLRVLDVEDIPVRSDNLQQLVRSAEYRIRLLDPVDVETVRERIASLLASERIIKEEFRRSGKRSVIDLRALIFDVTLTDEHHIAAHLATGDRGSMRLEDLLEHIGLANVDYAAHRFRLHIEG
jgi:radical SAM-linked protein